MVTRLTPSNAVTRLNPYTDNSTHSKSSGPRFGWFNHGHNAVVEGAIARLPQSPWKQFLQGSLDTIHNADDAQDLVYSHGKKHFMDLDNHKERFKWDAKSAAPWTRVNKTFTPAKRASVADHWRTNPLQPSDMGAPQTVYHAMYYGYQTIATQLKQMKDGNRPAVNAAEGDRVKLRQYQNIILDELARNVGAFSHYVGDSHVPLHLTRFFNWPLSPQNVETGDRAVREKRFAFKDGIHAFFEGEIMEKSDYAQVLRKPKAALRLSMERSRKFATPFNIKDTLVQPMSTAYLKLFDIVDVQRQAMTQFDPLHDKQAYRHELRRGLKPIVVNQLIQAQDALARLLQRVWEDAGRPEFPNR